MSEDAKVKTVDADGTKFDVYVTSIGEFYAIVDGECVKQATLKALEERLRKHVRTHNRVAIDATIVESNGWRGNDKAEFTDIVITGRHAGNNNVLYREPGDKHTQQLRSHNDDVCVRLSKADRAELSELVKKRTQSREAVERWLKSKRLNAGAAIDAAHKSIT